MPARAVVLVPGGIALGRDDEAVAEIAEGEGLVVLRLDIDERGVLTRLEVLEDPGFGFSAAAAEAARKSRFSPARVNGRPAACRALLPVPFERRHGR